MSTTARQIRSKVSRAHENISEFQTRAAAFHKANPHIIRTKEDLEAGQRVWFVAVVPAIPDSLASIAADAIGNLRKPLDYIATQIEVAAGRERVRGVYFPVGRDAANYQAQRRRYIQAAGKAALYAFDATEPYKGGRGEIIWQLHELYNPDKHTAPLALSGGYHAVDISPDLRAGMAESGFDPHVIPPLFIKPADRLCPLEAGDELFRAPLDHKVEEDRTFLLEIAFDNCADCLPAQRARVDARFLERLRERQRELHHSGSHPSHSDGAQRRRGETNARHGRARHAWEQANPSGSDALVYRSEILPRLRDVSISQLASATGLSASYCSAIRKGERVPHPRWWETLREL
jgi:hypothetical protein